MVKRRKLTLLIIAALFLFCFLLYINFRHTLSTSRSPERYLFAEVSGFKLEREFTGTEAIEMVKRSHMGSLKAPSDMAIGYYQEGLTIWITKYSSEKVATQETKRMIKAIGRFGRGFKPPTKTNVNGYPVYRTNYRGSFQYFWNINDFLIYIVPGLLSDSDVKDLIIKINNRL